MKSSTLFTNYYDTQWLSNCLVNGEKARGNGFAGCSGAVRLPRCPSVGSGPAAPGEERYHKNVAKRPSRVDAPARRGAPSIHLAAIRGRGSGNGFTPPLLEWKRFRHGGRLASARPGRCSAGKC